MTEAIELLDQNLVDRMRVLAADHPDTGGPHGTVVTDDMQMALNNPARDHGRQNRTTTSTSRC
ncbi:hypothetical protein [Nocardia lijiangensis]|uniref:hypothetical protein n=1 Tax=Nocardia lijiangensis TaxID=299618 RepID=UPI0012DC941B|nr:hypothetical protein [Nocardia lijiangensis]